MTLGGGKDHANSIGSDLLLDADRAVDVEELVNVDAVVVLYVDVIVGNRDRARRREAGRKARGDVRVRDYTTG